MLITSRDTGRWVLPKGNIDNGEKARAAALREAAEEAGIWGSIAEKPMGAYRYNKRRADGSAPRVTVSVWPVKVEGIGDDWPEADERTRGWFSPADAALMVDEGDLARLLERFDG